MCWTDEWPVVQQEIIFIFNRDIWQKETNKYIFQNKQPCNPVLSPSHQIKRLWRGLNTSPFEKQIRWSSTPSLTPALFTPLCVFSQLKIMQSPPTTDSMNWTSTSTPYCSSSSFPLLTTSFALSPLPPCLPLCPVASQQLCSARGQTKNTSVYWLCLWTWHSVENWKD